MTKTLNYYGNVFLILAVIAAYLKYYDETSTLSMFSILAVSSIYHVGSALMKKLEAIHADILKTRG